MVAACRELCARHGTQLTLFRSQFRQDERNLELARLVQELGPHSPLYGCSDPFYEIKVRSTGEVMSCSYGRMCGDSIHEKDLDEVWNSPWYRALRRALYAKVYEGRCEHCPFMHGSAQNQLDPLRPGVHHSRAARFLGA